MQYVDQNIPRALGERAPLGLVPNPDHDEVRWTAWRGERQAVALTLAGKFPTGRTGAHNDETTAEVPIQPGSYDALAQASLRVRRKDQPGDTPEDVAFTGGEYVQLSPGLRVHMGADRGWVFGATWEFAAAALRSR